MIERPIYQLRPLIEVDAVLYKRKGLHKNLCSLRAPANNALSETKLSLERSNQLTIDH